MTRGGLQELGELALWEHDRLGEVIEFQGKNLADSFGHRICTRRNHFVPNLEPDLVGVGTGCRALHRPHDREDFVIGLELDKHPGSIRPRGDHRSDGSRPQSWHPPVQGEDHRVDQARLSRPGRTAQGEEVDVTEIDRRGLFVSHETFEVDSQRSHADTSSSSSAKSASSFASSVFESTRYS